MLENPFGDAGAWPVAKLVDRLRAAPSWQRKRDLEIVSHAIPGLAHDVGDDAIAIPDEEGYLLLAAEVMWPPLVALEPEGAGRNAVLANANDIYAMGGRPTALLDTVLAPGAPDAEAILRGLSAAAERYGIPVLGGHLTLGAEVSSLAAFIAGRATCLLSGRAAAPGDVLLLLTGPQGSFHPQFLFWDCSLDRTDAELRADLEMLPLIAEAGWCDAARDVSMPGILGSTLQLLEGSGVGARIDLGAIPFPPEARGREVDWLLSFPSYAFVLSVDATRVAEIVALASTRNRVCVAIGNVTPGPRVDLVSGRDVACLWDFARESFTGFGAHGR